ncbi:MULTISPECIES: hypothetical protein [Halolamina]|uniref:hypothetical protein n=1 Tax=Halolamina TaxID=1075397 RepID=UPI000944F865|nr:MULTISPECIES: hypothetical protein [Halolamina]NHX35589.1 hypothetical protein [Halolamina sp. R1-12]
MVDRCWSTIPDASAAVTGRGAPARAGPTLARPGTLWLVAVIAMVLDVALPSWAAVAVNAATIPVVI